MVRMIRFLLVFARGWAATHGTLAIENALLRHQIAVLLRTAQRPRLRTFDRLLWVIVSRLLPSWRRCLLIVQPATVVAWHRAGFRLFWRRKSRHKNGRPPITAGLQALVRRIAAENPLWGIPRIQAELAFLGIHLARATIAKYSGRPLGGPARSSTWRTFIRNHMNGTAAMDFLTVPTLSGRVLYVFIILDHARRRILHFHVTQHPTAFWVAQQLREAFPFASEPRYLIRDNDSIFGDAVSRTMRMMITEVITSLGSPWQNAYAERFIGTLRRECLDHVIVRNEHHLTTIIGDFLTYYHQSRPHQGLNRDSPDGRAAEPPGDGPIMSEPMVGGLHHRYRRAA